MFLKRLARNHLNLETKGKGKLKAKERRMLQSRKRERNLLVSIVHKMAMMKTIVGNYIQN